MPQDRSTRQDIDVAALIDRITYLEKVIKLQQKIIQRERNKAAEMGSELWWMTELLANPLLVDQVKVKLLAYMTYARGTKKDEDGYFYYSCKEVARFMGGRKDDPAKKPKKEQSFYPVHTALIKFGYITSKEEPQKGNKQAKNHYDKLSDAFLLYPKSILLDDHSLWGGGRVAVHKGCGGKCIEEVVYNCTKCGVCHITSDEVYKVPEEEYESRQRLEMSTTLPTMEELDEYNPTVDAADIPDHLIDIHGSKVLTMPTKDLQKANKLTRLEYEGIDADDLDSIITLSQGLYQINDKQGRKSQ